jgi:uncharacterized protein YdbL (DUF1318 family)
VRVGVRGVGYTKAPETDAKLVRVLAQVQAQRQEHVQRLAARRQHELLFDHGLEAATG